MAVLLLRARQLKCLQLLPLITPSGATENSMTVSALLLPLKQLLALRSPPSLLAT